VVKGGKKWYAHDMFFRGRSLRTLDTKSRLMLTPDFRELIFAGNPQGAFVLTTRDRGLVGYPMPLWQELESAFAALKNPSREVRDFMRLFIGGAEEITPDAQGRILLSRGHLGYAGIEREAWLVGMVSKFEIWSPDRLDVVLAADFSDISERLIESGADIVL